ncbi:hypothetical_protein [Candidozyma auris]|uniref:ribonuclease P n=1 Tax=Candidozyma auris TaxID=498019 RepID=UPI000D28068E|nr:ribonuclease P [[Candida] auris]QEO23758.1 hypothetical_protein [[Candida] auris]GBL52182.1 hypothetical protein CAJCM15448_44560 [[Candida] auris]
MAFKLREPRIQFFQSSFPYLNNNALTKYSRKHTRHWRSDEPHPSNHRYLSIASGHYGIYFTILNHELRREEKAGLNDTNSHILLVFPSSTPLAQSIPYLIISKVKDEVYSHINHLKDVSRELLSSWALVKPRSLKQQRTFIRHFSTSGAELDRDPLKLYSLSQPKIEELPVEPTEEQPFEDSFQKTQAENIMRIYNNHTSSEELDVIYPLYQSLKRNDIPLPSILHYNIVLESILLRSLDNQTLSLTAIESRLTNLLTVYQDVLRFCSKSSLKPDSTTYDLVLKGVFDGCVDTITAGRSPVVAQHIYHEFEAKASEFCQVGVELFMSLKDHQALSLTSLMPSLLAAVTSYPQVLSAELIKKILELRDIPVGDGYFYVGLIDLSKYFASTGVDGSSKEEIHKYLISVYEDFKSNTDRFSDLLAYEYNVYSALISALIGNGNLSLATKFLDDILRDYRSALQASAKDIDIAKQKVSSLLSVYLEAIMETGTTSEIHRSYNLLEKFNKVPYLPELSTHVYNKLIGHFINEYSSLEMQKESSKSEKLLKAQKTCYDIIWRLYESVAIRSDFQNSQYDATIFPKKYASCREHLLSLSIDLNDQAKILRIVKEIIAKNHAIVDWNVSKKLVIYLVNASEMLNNDEYTNLCWSILEQQSTHHFEDSTKLNSFVSEHIPYLTQFTTEVSSNRLSNSPMIRNAFAGFQLSSDNIFGLMCAMNYFMQVATSQELSNDDKVKVLQYQANLIKEFEDTENHYLQLSDELIQFKTNVKNSFVWLASSLPSDVRVTPDITQVFKLLGLEAPSGVGERLNAIMALDYSEQLSIEFSKGVDLVITALKHGYNFNALTWKVIINRNFVIDVLAREKSIMIFDFIARLLHSSLEVNEKHALLAQIISFNHEKINIEIMKMLLTDDFKESLGSGRVMDAFANFFMSTSNKYFVSLFERSFETFVSSCENNKWLAKAICKVSSTNKSHLVELIPDQRIYSLDAQNQDDVELLASVVTCFIDLNRDAEVTKLMKHYYSGDGGNRALMNSNKMISVLVDFYIRKGDYDVVLDRFEEFADRSLELKQAVKFANLMAELSGHKARRTSTKDDEDISTFALSLLSLKDFGQMSKLLESNKVFLRNKTALFDSLVYYLTKASTLSAEKTSNKLKCKFEALMRLSKVMRLKELAVDSLINVIRLLAAMRARDLLNILVNKFVNRNETASVINLYFLQIKISSAHEANKLKQEFESALRSVGDEINLASLKQAV